MNKISLTKKIIFPAILIFLSIIVAVICTIPSISEFFAKTFSRGINYIWACMGSVFSFVAFEWLIVLIVALLFVLIVSTIVLLCLKRWRTLSFLYYGVLNIILVGVLFFNVTTGSLYHRTTIDKGLGIDKVATDQITETELYLASVHYISLLNETCKQVLRDDQSISYSRVSVQNMSSTINHNYDFINQNKYLNNYSFDPKELVMSDMMSYLSINGICMPFTGESGINANAFDYEKPCIVAHEIAHSKGVMRENEANVLSYIVCLKGSTYMQYSAYCNIVQDLLYEINKTNRNLYVELYGTIDSVVTKEWQLAYEDSRKYNSFLGDIGTTFNNIYLTINGVGGVKNYSETSGYILGMYRNSLAV